MHNLFLKVGVVAVLLSVAGALSAKPAEAAGTLPYLVEFLKGAGIFVGAVLAVAAALLYTDLGRGVLLKALMHAFFADDKTAAKFVKDIIIPKLRHPDHRADLCDLLKLCNPRQEDPTAQALEAWKVFQQMLAFANQFTVKPKELP